jgi:pimeloyl-ACP methyl ester carboxylesterase
MLSAKPYGRLRYREIAGKRMAYVDEGDGPDGITIVFQHGNPTSSYLRRNVMPHLEGLGRLVACDLIGVTSPDAGSDRLVFTLLGRVGPVQPEGCCVRHVRLPAAARDRSVGRRIPLG